MGNPVIISSYAWIGAHSTIMPGVEIGRGGVVGTMALVCKNVDPNNIVGDIPSKIIGKRNNRLKYQYDYHPRFS